MSSTTDRVSESVPSSSLSVVDRWYKALLFENCKEIYSLLQENPQLVLRGWRREETVKLTYISPFSSSQRPKNHDWRGRTALHVAVKKGWKELVIHILGMNFVQLDGCLDQLLVQEDGYCGLNALAMAVISGNAKIIDSLAEASLKCPNNPYEIERRPPTATQAAQSNTGEITGEAERIINETIEKTMGSLQQVERERVLKLYERDEDFSFLPWQSYIFHFICKHIVPADLLAGGNFLLYRKVEKIRTNHLDTTLASFASTLTQELIVLDPAYIISLFERHDSLGRTPLHVAVDNFTVPQVLRWIPEGSAFKSCLNAVDAAGRTPLYTAAAIRRIWFYQVEQLLHDPRTDVNAVFSPPVKDWPFDIDKLSRMNGYKGVLKDEFDDQVEYSATALHIAILRGHGYTLECLLRSENLDRLARFRRKVEFDGSLSRYGRRVPKFWSTPLQLAAMLFPFDRRIDVLDHMLKDDKFYDVARLEESPGTQHDVDEHSALHYAAFSGNSDAVKLILASNRFDYFTTNAHKCTALHFAVDVRGKPIRTHLLDRVNCWWTEYWNQRGQEADLDDEEYLVFEREQTIDHLLHAGMDMWKVNAWGNRPNPGPWASQEARSRWNKRMEIRTSEVHNRLNSGGRAISVTATLVATASYIGPLQPPLGYDGANGLMHIEDLPVRIFTVCNTLSFYLAVASISLALIPSLPIRGGAIISLINELEETQITMMVGSVLLFLSILNVVAAFAAASMAVVSQRQPWSYGGLSVSTAAIGGLVCVVVSVVCLWRLLKPMLFHHPTTRKLYLSYRLRSTTVDMPSSEEDPRYEYSEARTPKL